jgi:hypothetical protein
LKRRPSTLTCASSSFSKLFAAPAKQLIGAGLAPSSDARNQPE